jgi:tetratricopeptide (TPR) repeat protein
MIETLASDRVPDDVSAAARLAKGIALVEQGHYDRAIFELTAAVARIHFLRGATLQDLGRLDSALADFTRAIALEPNYADAYFRRGVLHAAASQTELALADFSMAVEHNPAFAQAWLRRALLYAGADRLEEAIADFSRALEADPQLHVVYAERGMARARLGQFAQAVDDLTIALVHDRDNARLLYERGRAFTNAGRLDAALADFTRSLELDPAFVRAHAYRAAVYRHQGRHGEALADYFAALCLDPAYAVQYVCQCGLVHAAQGKFQRAVGDFSVALAMDPGNVAVRRWVEQAKEAWEKQQQRACEPEDEKTAVPVAVRVHDVAVTPTAETAIVPVADALTLVEDEAAQALLETGPEEERRADEKERRLAVEIENLREQQDSHPARLAIQRAMKETAASVAVNKPKRARLPEPIDEDDGETTFLRRQMSFLERRKRPLVAALVVIGLSYFFFPSNLVKAWSRPHLQPVRGQAFFLDQPMPQASVVLDPLWTKTPDFPRPHGVVGDDGSFALSTYGHDDGAPAGEYRAIVTWFVRESGEDYDGAPAPKNKLPAKYGKFDTSGLSVRIETGHDEIPALNLR